MTNIWYYTGTLVPTGIMLKPRITERAIKKGLILEYIGQRFIYLNLFGFFSYMQADEEEEEEDEEEEEEELQFSVEEQLDMLVEYLRSEHRYCVFCGIRNAAVNKAWASFWAS